jgi:hypothetical protein
VDYGATPYGCRDVVGNVESRAIYNFEDPKWGTEPVSRVLVFLRAGIYEVVWEKFGRCAESLARSDPAGSFDIIIIINMLVPAYQ